MQEVLLLVPDTDEARSYCKVGGTGLKAQVEVCMLQRYCFSAYVIGITSLQRQESALLYIPSYPDKTHLGQFPSGLVSECC